MRMVRPKLDAPQITIAEEQDAFMPVTAALVRHPSYPGVQTEHGAVNSVVLAFRPSDEERARLAAGEDIYITLLTFMKPMQAILVSAGSWEPSAWFNVRREVDSATNPETETTDNG